MNNTRRAPPSTLVAELRADFAERVLDLATSSAFVRRVEEQGLLAFYEGVGQMPYSFIRDNEAKVYDAWYAVCDAHRIAGAARPELFAAILSWRP